MKCNNSMKWKVGSDNEIALHLIGDINTEKMCISKCVKILNSTIKILIFKVALGVFDVGSDIVNGYNFISGQFLLGLYFASLTREDYDLLPGNLFVVLAYL